MVDGLSGAEKATVGVESQHLRVSCVESRTRLKDQLLYTSAAKEGNISSQDSLN